MADRVTIYILNRAGVVAGILDQALKFTAVARWQDLGSWSVTVRSTSPGAAELKRGASVAILVDGVVFCSGPITQFITTSDLTGDVIEASGPDDLTWLDRTLGYPAAPSIDPNAAATSDISGAAEDVIYGYVNINCGPSALPERQRVRVAASNHAGSTVNESVRADTILVVATRIALVDDLGLRCRWDADSPGLPIFEVVQGRNAVAAVQFSAARGTIAKATVTDIAPSATNILVGGSGTGTGRVFAQVDDDPAAARWFRVESFVDAGDISDAATLIQRAEGSLQQSGRTIVFEAVETKGMRFGDWLLGDTVSGEAGGVADVFVIVQIELSGPPFRLKPTLAQFAGYRLGQLEAVQQRVLGQRLRSLETN